MARPLLETIVVPIASEDDADETCQAILDTIDDEDEHPTIHAVHVIEKAGGAPDKAGVEQREERAARIFDRVGAFLADESVTLETELLYGTDVAATVLDRARELDATAIVFTPRGASRWLKLLSGDVERKLLSQADRPLVVLPRSDQET
ncbi:universal stress protein [Natrinema sp. HArc-T2]|uniref:universal stress protein n=1 Tax=Natrinema sp. HArc-T2 TaxID=3242701 RepID=UPI00359EEF7E